MPTQFIEMLKMKRKGMNKYQRNQSYKTKLPKILYPSTIERRYANDIINWMKELVDYVNNIITTDLLDDWISELKVDMRQDSFQTLFSTIIGGLKEKASKLFAGSEKRGIATAWAGQISDHNQNQVQKSFSKLLGFKYIQPELWESSVIQAWSQNNYNLITSLSDDYIKNVNRIVSDGVMNGKDSRSIKKDLTKLNKQLLGDKYRKVRVRNKNGKMTTVTKRIQGKAGLLARDQVASLNGQLTKRRMQEAGLGLYEWQTAGDERVRQQDPKRRNPNTYPSHRDMDGTINKWDNNDVYSKDGGKTFIKRPAPMQGETPGSAVQCRCSALAFMGEIYDTIDEGI